MVLPERKGLDGARAACLDTGAATADRGVGDRASGGRAGEVACNNTIPAVPELLLHSMRESTTRRVMAVLPAVPTAKNAVSFAYATVRVTETVVGDASPPAITETP
jgi:hypothetical protein